MALNGDQYGFFWNSNEGDRKYDAESFSTWLKKFFTTGVFQNDLQVTKQATDGDMVVRVGTGYANVDGKVMFFPDEQTFTLDAGHGTYPRFDAIVVEKNEGTRSIITKVVKGAYNGTTPDRPIPVRAGGVYQIVLAYVYVNKGVTALTQADIEDKRPDSTVCGWVMGTVDRFDISQIMAQSEEEFSQWETQRHTEFNAWEIAEKADFEAWFLTLQNQLDDNQAAHLQNEINAVSDRVDVAYDQIEKVICQEVWTADTNLDDYTTQGLYFFGSEYTPIGIPIGINGFLQVIVGDIFVKQIWYRAGTAGTNDSMTFIREKGSNGWGAWDRIVSERQLEDIAHIVTYAETGEGDGIYFQGGGTTIIGAGEAAQKIIDNDIESVRAGTTEKVILAADNSIVFFSNCNTISERKRMAFESGILYTPRLFIGGTAAKNEAWALTYDDNCVFKPHSASWQTNNSNGVYWATKTVSGWRWIYSVSLTGSWGALTKPIIPYIIDNNTIGFMSETNNFPSSSSLLTVRIVGVKS